MLAASALHPLHPLRVGQVPLHGFADARLEGLGRLPAQFPFDLARVDGVAPIVTRTILHEIDLGFVAAAVGLGAQFVQQGADSVHDLDVGLFVPAAHVVGIAQLASSTRRMALQWSFT